MFLRSPIVVLLGLILNSSFGGIKRVVGVKALEHPTEKPSTVKTAWKAEDAAFSSEIPSTIESAEEAVHTASQNGVEKLPDEASSNSVLADGIRSRRGASRLASAYKDVDAETAGDLRSVPSSGSGSAKNWHRFPFALKNYFGRFNSDDWMLAWTISMNINIGFYVHSRPDILAKVTHKLSAEELQLIVAWTSALTALRGLHLLLRRTLAFDRDRIL